MRFGLMAPGFNPNDAVGNDILGMYMALQGRGTEATIFTPTGEAVSAIPVMHYADVPFILTDSEDVLVYHYCVADPVALAVIRRLNCRVVIKYHNVTPAHLMSRFSVDFAQVCRIGRELLARFPDLPINAFISDSEYNADELIKFGVAQWRSYVCPPIHRIEELVGQPDNPQIMQQLRQNSYNVLAVGRVVPNKGFDLMVKSFADALDAKVVDFHLHLVGVHDARLQAYIDLVGRILVDRGVRSKFTFHGLLSSSALATLYRHSDIFWTTSLHEGFCVPAVEAMAFGLPILSSRHAALPETCGDAALYGSSTRDFATKLVELLCNDEARSTLGRKGRQRYEASFRGSTLKRQFLATLDEILQTVTKRVPASSLQHDGEWFGLPDAPRLLKAALAVSGALYQGGLEGHDRRADFIDWVLREGWHLSPEISHYLQEPAFAEYANDIEVPNPASYLGAIERLVWRFHRYANSRFDLQSVESVSDYLRWYERTADKLYKPFPSV